LRLRGMDKVDEVGKVEKKLRLRKKKKRKIVALE
jgi:hypothetical protein